MTTKVLNTIEEAIEDFRNGKVVIVVDDEDRENEGDFICAAQFATTENVNFMAVHGKGLICMPMAIDLCQKLAFPQMVTENTDNHETAFTVSIDHVDTTTGISAAERSITAMKCVDENAKPEAFRPRRCSGFCFPCLPRQWAPPVAPNSARLFAPPPFPHKFRSYCARFWVDTPPRQAP